MKYDFKNRDLLELYKTGKSRKLRLDEEIVKKFFMRLQSIEAATSIYDLWNLKSLKFEKLQGFDNRYSIRLTRERRLELEIEWENEEQTIGKFLLLKISKHYGD